MLHSATLPSSNGSAWLLSFVRTEAGTSEAGKRAVPYQTWVLCRWLAAWTDAAAGAVSNGLSAASRSYLWVYVSLGLVAVSIQVSSQAVAE